MWQTGDLTDVRRNPRPSGIEQAVIYRRMIKTSVCSVANCTTEPHHPIYLFDFTSADQLEETGCIYDDNSKKIPHRLVLCWALSQLLFKRMETELKAPLVLCFSSPHQCAQAERKKQQPTLSCLSELQHFSIDYENLIPQISQFIPSSNSDQNWDLLCRLEITIALIWLKSDFT